MSHLDPTVKEKLSIVLAVAIAIGAAFLICWMFDLPQSTNGPYPILIETLPR